MTTGVVLTRTGGTYRVHTVDGEVTAVLRGKIKQADDDRVVAGDIVELALHREGPATVERVHTRRSVLAASAVPSRSRPTSTRSSSSRQPAIRSRTPGCSTACS